MTKTQVKELKKRCQTCNKEGVALNQFGQCIKCGFPERGYTKKELDRAVQQRDEEWVEVVGEMENRGERLVRMDRLIIDGRNDLREVILAKMNKKVTKNLIKIVGEEV